MSKFNSNSTDQVKTSEQVAPIASINDFVKEHQIAFRDCMLSALITRHDKGVKTPLGEDDIYYLYELHYLIKSVDQPEAMASSIKSLHEKHNGFSIAHQLKEVFNKVIRWEARNLSDGIFITDINLNTVDNLIRLFDSINLNENSHAN